MSQENKSALEDNLPRRGFLKIAIAGLNGLIALALAVPGLGYLLTPVFRKGSGAWIPLGPPERFHPGEPAKVTFKYISESGYTQTQRTGFVWVVENESGEGVTVFSAVCSHTGCNVAWQADDGQFVCPCHGGRYDIKGAVVSGPPPRPLTKLPLKIENDELSIQLLS